METESLGRTGWFGTCSKDQLSLELIEIHLLCLLSARIKSVHHHTQKQVSFLNTSIPVISQATFEGVLPREWPKIAVPASLAEFIKHQAR